MVRHVAEADGFVEVYRFLGFVVAGIILFAAALLLSLQKMARQAS